MVDYVVPDGPAATAGVQQNDIMKMLNDQILMEPDQLSKLIRSYPDGTNVTLTVLRKRQESKITVKLGKKEISSRKDFREATSPEMTTTRIQFRLQAICRTWKIEGPGAGDPRGGPGCASRSDAGQRGGAARSAARKRGARAKHSARQGRGESERATRGSAARWQRRCTSSAADMAG